MTTYPSAPGGSPLSSAGTTTLNSTVRSPSAPAADFGRRKVRMAADTAHHPKDLALKRHPKP